jgi:hypothetical protein
MLFSKDNCDKVLCGCKTQTRRLVKEGDYLDSFGHPEIVYSGAKKKWMRSGSYAIQPGRGKSGHPSARVSIVGIRQERLQDISTEDVIAEGIETGDRQAFAKLWNGLNKRKGERWQDNPWVYVLTLQVWRGE